MHLLSVVLATGSLLSSIVGASISPRRGLVHVVSKDHAGTDDPIWINKGLSWYYNYQIQPTPAYANIPQSDFEFVPQLWGINNTFLSDILAMIKGGRNITHVLTYNEPDGSMAYGGSDIQPAVAAANWITQIEPLRKLGIRVSAPAVTSSDGGFTWLQSFFAACQSQGTNCTADFFPVHWYGDFQGLADHMGRIQGTFGNTSMWITEWAAAHQSLATSQKLFNDTINYFEQNTPSTYVARHSYFGSFRSDVSNVGPNSAMLTEKGLLTDIGSWYLGGVGTNNIPKGSASSLKLGTTWVWVMTAAVAFSFIL